MAVLNLLKRAVSKKKAILLDLDNTLYAYKPCHEFALKKVYAHYCRQYEKVSRGVFNEAYHAARKIINRKFYGKAVSHSRLLYFKLMLGRSNGAKELERVYWNAFLRKAKLRSWAVPFLSYCGKTDKKIGIVTNLTTAIQKRKWKQFKLSRYADFMLTSEQAGVEKPHPKIFRLALKKLKTKPKEAIVIGDDKQSDKVSFLDCVILKSC